MKSRKSLKGSEKVAIAYLRVSTDEQALGVEAQRASIETWATAKGITIASWHVDQGVSGADADRPAMTTAITALKRSGAGVFLIAKRDRLARDVVLAATFQRAILSNGAVVTSADGSGNGDTAADAFMRTILDGAAEYERALIRSRTSAAMQAKRAKGERVSARVPFGQAVADDGVHLVPVQSEQAIITRARSLRKKGLSLAKVATTLTLEGHLSRSGAPFLPVQVQRMLT